MDRNLLAHPFYLVWIPKKSYSIFAQPCNPSFPGGVYSDLSRSLLRTIFAVRQCSTRKQISKSIRHPLIQTLNSSTLRSWLRQTWVQPPQKVCLKQRCAANFLIFLGLSWFDGCLKGWGSLDAEDCSKQVRFDSSPSSMEPAFQDASKTVGSSMPATPWHQNIITPITTLL